MTTFIDATVSDIDERLRQANDELERLRAARSALVGSATAPRSTPTNGRQRRGRKSSNGQRRGSKGNRAGQALELLRKRPMTIPELAAEMQIAPNYLYRVLPPLEADGKVKRDGKTWHPTA